MLATSKIYKTFPKIDWYLLFFQKSLSSKRLNKPKSSYCFIATNRKRAMWRLKYNSFYQNCIK